MRTGSFQLMLLGLLGVAFFLLTDARFGFGSRLDGIEGTNPIDAMHSVWPGTVIGIGGSITIALIGFWLTVRRPV